MVDVCTARHVKDEMFGIGDIFMSESDGDDGYDTTVDSFRVTSVFA